MPQRDAASILSRTASILEHTRAYIRCCATPRSRIRTLGRRSVRAPRVPTPAGRPARGIAYARSQQRLDPSLCLQIEQFPLDLLRSMRKDAPTERSPSACDRALAGFGRDLPGCARRIRAGVTPAGMCTPELPRDPVLSNPFPVVFPKSSAMSRPVKIAALVVGVPATAYYGLVRRARDGGADDAHRAS